MLLKNLSIFELEHTFNRYKFNVIKIEYRIELLKIVLTNKPIILLVIGVNKNL